MGEGIFQSGDSILRLRYFLTIGFHSIAFSRYFRSRIFGVDPPIGVVPLSSVENASEPRERCKFVSNFKG